MDSLNFQHLRYFWTVAREGSLTRAAQSLELSPSTLSEQVRALEDSLGCQLFTRTGRELSLTTVGRRIAHYADEVFQIGKLIMGIAQSNEAALTSLHFRVGFDDVISKLAVHKFTEPLLRLGTHVQLSFSEENSLKLLSEFNSGKIDIAISSDLLGASEITRGHERYFSEAEVYFFASEFLWEKYHKNYPTSLNGAPFFLPTEGTKLRRSLEKWFDEHSISPRIIGEGDDTSLMKVFGQSGAAIFPATAFVKKELEMRFNLRSFNSINGVKEVFLILLAEKAINNSDVREAICKISGVSLRELDP